MGTDTLEIEYDWHLSLAKLYDTIDLEVPWDWRKQHVQNYMPSSNAQRIGAIAESKFQTECLERDFEPHMPATPMPWDFIVTCPAGMLKVQVKSSSVKNGQSYNVMTSSGCTGKSKMSHDVDVIACYIAPEKMWWMIPRSELTGKTVKLNPEPTSKSRYKKYQENWSIFYE
jgi:hypothetical protein